MTTLVPFSDPDRFAETIVPFLEKNEAENGRFIGMLQLTQSNPLAIPPVMIQIKEGRKTVAAAFRRHRNLVVTRNIESACVEIANYLRETGVDLLGVEGPSASARRFAEVWTRGQRCKASLAADRGLYWIKTIDWPESVAGRMRPMTKADTPVVVRWLRAFHKEAVPFAVGNGNAKRPPHTKTFIWEVGRVPVAMASLVRPSRRGIAINGVYTPPAFRGRGYATSLVAHVTAEGLKRGKQFCSLYTDISNPISNSIYKKVGYRLLSRARVYLFK